MHPNNVVRIASASEVRADANNVRFSAKAGGGKTVGGRLTKLHTVTSTELPEEDKPLAPEDEPGPPVEPGSPGEPLAPEDVDASFTP